MHGERTRALQPHVWGILPLLLLVLMLFTLLPAFGQETPNADPPTPWTGKLANGREITQADLNLILRAHARWLRSQGQEGKMADLRQAHLSGAKLVGANLSRASLEGVDLRGADLYRAILREVSLERANLSGAQLEKADLIGAWLIEVDLSKSALSQANLREAKLLDANLSGADLLEARLDKAKLARANLSGAILSNANLTRADLYGADLSGARLYEADLSRADLTLANLKGANLDKAILVWTTFEPIPGSVSDVTLLLNIQGLPSLRYKTSSHGLVELRENYKKAGLREPERQVTYALNHTRRIQVGEQGGFLGKLESLFQLICFEWPCQYGLNPGRPLKLLGLGLFLFTLPYLLALRGRDRQTGLWLLLPPDRIIGGGTKVRPFKLTSRPPFRPLPPGRWPRLRARLRRGLRRVRLAFYFSLLSAFNLGWRELNVGNWISRLQKHEYTLRATGWPRTVAGLQSLLSVYLLALWVLTYFGRPFD